MKGLKCFLSLFWWFYSISSFKFTLAAFWGMGGGVGYTKLCNVSDSQLFRGFYLGFISFTFNFHVYQFSSLIIIKTFLQLVIIHIKISLGFYFCIINRQENVQCTQIPLSCSHQSSPRRIWWSCLLGEEGRCWRSYLIHFY